MANLISKGFKRAGKTLTVVLDSADTIIVEGTGLVTDSVASTRANMTNINAITVTTTKAWADETIAEAKVDAQIKAETNKLRLETAKALVVSDDFKKTYSEQYMQELMDDLI